MKAQYYGNLSGLKITNNLNYCTMHNQDELPTIDFSYNWNGKLNCNSFTTIRLANPNKYQIGLDYLVKLNTSERPQQIELQSQYSNVAYIGSETSYFPIYCHSYLIDNGDYVLSIKIKQVGRDLETSIRIPIGEVFDIHPLR